MKKLILISILLLGIGCKQTEPDLEVVLGVVKTDQLKNTSFIIPATIETGDYYEKADINLAGVLFTKYEKDKILDQIKSKIDKKQPLTNSFNKNEITDLTIFNSLIGNYTKKCSSVLNSYRGQIPIPLNTLVDLIKIDC